ERQRFAAARNYSFEELSQGMKNGVVTVVLLLPGFQASQRPPYDEVQFRVVVVELLGKLMNTIMERKKNVSSNDPTFKTQFESQDYSADNVVYVRPTPKTVGKTLTISFLVENITEE
ncbi:uncharacterized protein LOC111084499, partial [Limulus polyphemus]|uniref:Uncharacterized protein LOC111084499 n=1 Tax=Limulus polyphemus TaxID=6850 RepID=A0ABM1RZV5_LIMPO